MNFINFNDINYIVIFLNATYCLVAYIFYGNKGEYIANEVRD